MIFFVNFEHYWYPAAFELIEKTFLGTLWFAQKFGKKIYNSKKVLKWSFWLSLIKMKKENLHSVLNFKITSSTEVEKITIWVLLKFVKKMASQQKWLK